MSDFPSRIEQLGHLFRAAIHVFKDGRSDLTAPPGHPEPSPEELQEIIRKVTASVHVMRAERATSSLRSSPALQRRAPLVSRYAHIYHCKKKGYSRELVEVLLPFVESKYPLAPRYILERHLRALPMLPSSIRVMTAGYMAMKLGDGRSPEDFLRSANGYKELFHCFPDIRGEVSRLTGADPSFISIAWRDSEGLLDDAWHALDEKLYEMSQTEKWKASAEASAK